MAAINGKRTLGHPASLPRHRGRSKALGPGSILQAAIATASRTDTSPRALTLSDLRLILSHLPLTDAMSMSDIRDKNRTFTARLISGKGRRIAAGLHPCCVAAVLCGVSAGNLGSRLGLKRS
jgi:hypothetical protein